MKEIELTQGKKAIVDDKDYEWLNKHRWHYARRRTSEYAATHFWTGEKQKTVMMHRLIKDAPKGIDVDHRDGNGLNNKRDNLRLASRSQNMRNTKPRNGKYKGISYRKGRGVYKAYIGTASNMKQLGHYVSEIAAACAYDYAAIEMFGEFARLNFPEGQPMTKSEVKEARGKAKKT